MSKSASVRLAMPADLVDGLAALGEAAGGTANTVLLAGIEVLLARFTMVENVAWRVSGRVAAQAAGPRVERPGTPPPSVPPVLGVAGRYRATQSVTDALRDLTDRLRAAVGTGGAAPAVGQADPVEQGAGGDPTRNVLVTFTDEPQRVPADLVFRLPTGRPGVVVAEHRVGAVDPEAVPALLSSLRTLLGDMVSGPDRELGALRLLTDDERERVLAWRGPVVSYPDERLAHERVADQARVRPDATAVVSATGRLTYRELDARANQLAHRLRDHGVRPGHTVAVCTTRSPSMIVGILAALKSGAAYLPVDPGYPRRRLELLLSDARPAVLVTESGLRGRLPTGSSPRIELDTDRDALLALPTVAPDVPTGPDDIAYVIFTSGSTGRPKGVEVAHAGLTNLIHWHQEAFQITEADRTTQMVGTAFDASVWEIWPTLTAGATLYLADETTLASAPDLVRWLVERDITVTLLPTSMAELALDEEWPDEGALRYMLVGGDTLHRHPPAGLPFALVNHYGPTENAVVTTGETIPPADSSNRREPSIGRPIPNTRVYVLDDRKRPVPVGARGELYVGGVGLARGYLNRPELTAERFVADPFGTGRLYRTGDIARWRGDGSLDFLGRVDDQVKLRGYRIELGEIETAALAHPGIANTAVLLREDTPGHPRLVCYLVPRAGAAPEPADLRAWLADSVPGYMVPSVFVWLDTLPLTRNGKVDRRALPVPEAGRPAGLGEYVAPRAGVEAEIAALWEDLLAVGPIGATDDFFALGGNSLTATRIVTQLRSSLGVALGLSTVLANPTVRELVGEVDRLRRHAPGDTGDPGLAGEQPDLTGVPIRRVDRDGRIPLTLAQRQLWLLDQLGAGAVTYHVPLAIELSGPLRTDLLGEAIRSLVTRHESLRTTFPTVDGEPVQRVSAPGEVDLAVHDVADLGGVAELDRWILAESRRPFDLAAGPLLRCRLLRRAEHDHLLLVVVHHIVFDGWSLGVFCRELGELYQAAVSPAGPDLPELSVQCADLAVWQREHLTDEALRSDLDYWRQALDGAPEVLELPTDFARPARLTDAGARTSVTLDRGLSDRVGAFCRAEGVTPFMVLLGTFQALLSRYSGSEDIVVGSPVAARVRPELEGLVGCFINTLPLRVDLSGAPGFRELMRRVRAVTLAGYAHQDVPSGQIVEAVQPDRSATVSPIFQVLMALEDAHEAEFEFAGVRATVTELDFGSTRSDLGVSITPRSDGLRVCAEYRLELFTEQTVHAMLEQFRCFLDHALSDPDRPITTLELLTEEQRHRMVRDWNDTEAPFPDSLCVHQMVECQVDATPDAPAVVFEGATLTYRQLDERANRLATRLRELGVGPETRVGLCVHRSPDMIVGLLAVLKAGGAYVPLDPTYPADRLAFMVADADLPVVLTHRALRSGLPDRGVRVLELDTEAAEIAARPATRPDNVTTPRGLAYVIYTSGSTGRPKGVMVEHRSVCNFVTTVHGLFGMGPHDNVLQFASLGFDVSVFEIFGALTCGARLCLARQETLLSVRDLTAFMQRHEISVMDMPPAVMSLLPGGAFPALRIAFVGGEAFSGGLVNEWVTPGRRFFNGYGPTEGTVTVIVEECSGNEWQHSPPIGRPMPNMRAHVLDRNEQLVPVGVPGELHIGGVGLARGYLNRPELTASRFVRDPFDADPQARLYKTGDLVRQRPDGRLDFLGRIDDQVKLRGFRIELGEIEAVLRDHPDVTDAVVLLREDTPGQRRLVGYLVPAPGDTPEPAVLRAYLAARLPQYMIPAALVTLAALPLNTSGKVDRRALPPPDTAAFTAVRELVEPRNRRERTLAEIWCRLLDLPRVGVHDSFFTLGGHSILAVRLVWEIHGSFGVDISIRDVFERPTVAALAELVESAMLALVTAEELANGARGGGPAGNGSGVAGPGVPGVADGEVPHR